MSWRMAKSLGATGTEGLLGEVNASAPNRNKASDGGIGDAAHSSRTSDHNPCDCHRAVCARDFMHDPAGGFDAQAFADWLSARICTDEARVKYLIWNRQICSGQGQQYPAGVWRKYSGSNPHTKHIHVSVRHPLALFDDTTRWGWTSGAVIPPAPPTPPELALPAAPIPESFPASCPPYPLPAGHWYGPEAAEPRNHSGYAASDRPWVRYLVLLLQTRGWALVTDTDRFTTNFAVQVQSFQAKVGCDIDGLVGPETFAAFHA